MTPEVGPSQLLPGRPWVAAVGVAAVEWVAVACVAVVLVGCPPNQIEEGDVGQDAGADAGQDAGPAQLGVELGANVDGHFQSFAADRPAVEVVSGFQGGYHLGPALRIDAPAEHSFIAVVDYTLTDVDTGESLAAEPSHYRVNESSWEPRPDGTFVRLWERYILEVDLPGEAAGRQVRIDVDVDIEGGGAGSDSVVVEVIDEVNELR